MGDNGKHFAGNTRGRDHIQWPTILREEIDTRVPGLTDDQKDATWPVDVTLAQIMALCWRVRRWELSGSIAVSKTIVQPGGMLPDIVTTQIGTATLSPAELYTMLNGVEASRERALVGKIFAEDDSPYKCLVNDGIGNVAGDEIESDWEQSGDLGILSGTSLLTMAVLGTPTGGYQLFDEDTGKFSPACYGFARVGSFPGEIGTLIPTGSALGASVFFSRDNSSVLSGPTPLLLHVPIQMTVSPGIAPPFNIPMQLSWRFIGEPLGATASGAGSGAFTLTATEFWPYSSKFDPDDGSKL